MFILCELCHNDEMFEFKKIGKYLVAGASSAVLEYGVFIVLSMASSRLLLFNQIVSFMCGFVTSFLLNKAWVFKSRADIKIAILQYGLLAIVNLVIATGTLYYIVQYEGLPQWLAKIIVMAGIAIWNYMIFNKLIFPEHSKKGINEKQSIVK